jgi:hypothetical protein
MPSIGRTASKKYALLKVRGSLRNSDVDRTVSTVQQLLFEQRERRPELKGFQAVPLDDPVLSNCAAWHVPESLGLRKYMHAQSFVNWGV